MTSQASARAKDRVAEPFSFITTLASYALLEVAVKAGPMTDTMMTETIPHDDGVERLYRGAISDNARDCSAVAQALLEEGVDADWICETLVPAVARRLGEDWCADTHTFATVSIASARLQYLLREVCPTRAGNPSSAPWRDLAPIMLLQADGLDHTLGVMVLATYLRRHGYPLTLALGRTPAEVTEMLRAQDHAAIFVSAALGASLTPVTELVSELRKNGSHMPPIVLGGTRATVSEADIRATGVDFATNDVMEALNLCGFTPMSE